MPSRGFGELGISRDNGFKQFGAKCGINPNRVRGALRKTRAAIEERYQRAQNVELSTRDHLVKTL